MKMVLVGGGQDNPALAMTVVDLPIGGFIVEIANQEVAAVESVVTEEVNSQLRELASLELMLVGGGQGDINFG